MQNCLTWLEPKRGTTLSANPPGSNKIRILASTLRGAILKKLAYRLAYGFDIKAFFIICLTVILASCAPSRPNQTATIAVAANFKTTLDELETAFEASTAYELDLVTGSTGKLYAQIIHGAPYDVFLAADQVRPEQLVTDGQAVAGSWFTYALGRLVLLGGDSASVLSAKETVRVAIANPDLAPYGKAATQVLGHLDLEDEVAPKLVLGENVGQAFAFVTTGNAQLGFVSEAQVRTFDTGSTLSTWRPSSDLYDPIAQDAVLLQRAAENSAAMAFIDFLKSDVAHEIISRHGYDLP